MGRTYIAAIGYAGAYGTADIIKEHEEELRSRYRSSFVNKMTQSCAITGSIERAAELLNSTAEAVHTEMITGAGDAPYIMPYGYLGALYELARERRCGLRIRIRQIPVMQETIEICELYCMDPYRLPTYGRLVLTEDPYRLLEDIPEESRRMAACIGYLTEDHDKLIIDKTNIEYINRR